MVAIEVYAAAVGAVVSVSAMGVYRAIIWVVRDYQGKGQRDERLDREIEEVEDQLSRIEATMAENTKERKEEHRKVWEGLASLHTSIRTMIQAWNRQHPDERVETANHPFEYRGGD